MPTHALLYYWQALILDNARDGCQPDAAACLQLMRHRATGQSQCFGFIDFLYAHSAASAITSMDGQRLPGLFRERPLWVRPSFRA